MSEAYRKYGDVPLKQTVNRVWRTYIGGKLIDRWKQSGSEEDGALPEEWIMSTIAANGKGRPADEGLSLMKTAEGLVPLKDIIASDLPLFLGDKLANKFGTTGVLIKMLDAKERLTIQVHPDKEFARNMLDSQFGKTESWYILDSREIDGETPAIFLGFKEHVTPEIWQELFRKQDTAGMLDCLHRFDVEPGDAFMIYGGVPHAIGSGCFLMEVQEPTDYTMRVEKVTPGGLAINDDLIHQGIGEENMLKCFHYDGCSHNEASRRWKITPEAIDTSPSHELKSVFNEKHTDCFGLSELELDGDYELATGDSFFAAVIYHGEGSITCNGQDYSYAQGDEIFFPAAINNVTFKSKTASKILLCYPPS